MAAQGGRCGTAPESAARDLFRAVAAGQPRRLVTGVAFALLAIAASILVARRLTDSSWPLANVRPLLAATAGFAYLASFVFRARGWHRLFPPGQCPDQARCLASVGAAAASGAVLPFRLDYVVKVGVLRKLGGIRIGLEAIVLSIISLGMIDGIAMLPLAISATATSGAALLGPLLIVVAFGVGCCTLLVVGVRLLRLPAAAPEPPPAHNHRADRAPHDAPWTAQRHRRLVLPLRLLVRARIRQRRAPSSAWVLVLADDRALGDLPWGCCRRNPDHLRRCGRECRRVGRDSARARCRQGHRDQLLARLRTPGRNERARRHRLRDRWLARDRRTGPAPDREHQLRYVGLRARTGCGSPPPLPVHE